MIRFFWGVCAIALLVLAAAFLLQRDMRQVLNRPLNLQQATFFEVVKGRRLDQVIADVAQRGWLPERRAQLYLRAYVRLKPQLAGVKAGEYQLAPGLTPLGLLRLFASGKIFLHELRIVEGWRFAQALEAIRLNPVLEHTLPANATAAQIMALLGHANEDAEGRFFPDTYHFPRGTTDIAYLRRAYAAAEKLLKEEWERRDPNLPYRTPYEALIMASIVERETGAPEERAQIAGVFVRRLAKGMRLQTDPTVIYGLGDRFDGNLRKNDLLADAPYNTYTRAGLPPTPICLPGRAALHAALHPAPGDALYFVSRGDGTHQFSATLAEHDAAVRQYQLRRRATP
jgi:UPF0755 protein